MEKVGIKQLKRDASAILKAVRENSQTIVVTYRGEPVAQIVPFERDEERRRRIRDGLARMDELAATIGELTEGSVSAVDLVREQRRDLGDVRG